MKLLIFLFLLSCITPKINSFYYHINEFKEEFPGEEIPEIVFVVYTDQFKYGLCDYEAGNIIYINKRWWDKASTWQQRKVLWHELGHCVFKLHHTKDLYYDISIMNINIHTANEMNWNLLKKEFKCRITNRDADLCVHAISF